MKRSMKDDDRAEYDDEPSIVEQMRRYMEEQGYTLDISDQRLHHEIYLSVMSGKSRRKNSKQ